jgi:hypothetical protein
MAPGPGPGPEPPVAPIGHALVFPGQGPGPVAPKKTRKKPKNTSWYLVCSQFYNTGKTKKNSLCGVTLEATVEEGDPRRR